MSIKTEILNNLINQIKTNFPEFKKVERGLIALESKSLPVPLCLINSTRTIINREQTTYNRLVKSMYVYIDIIHQTRSNYYPTLDDFENRMIKLIDDLEYNKALHTNITTMTLEESQEVINDEYIDGLYHLRLTISIDYIEIL